MTYAIEHGAVGATSNPTIVLNVLKQEMDLWENRLYEIIQQNPKWTEEEITWQIFEEIGVKVASLFYPIFQREEGKKGRLLIQTNPPNYRNAEAITKQAVRFSGLAPNMQVKIPVLIHFCSFLLVKSSGEAVIPLKIKSRIIPPEKELINRKSNET